MDEPCCVVMTTLPDRESSERLAGMIVENRLAACVQMTDVSSVFLWEEALHREQEVLLFIKTAVRRYGELEACIRENHPYTTPEIVQLPITEGLSAYLGWIGQVTGSGVR